MKKGCIRNERDTNGELREHTITIEMKVNFIADYVMTKYDMKSFLRKLP